ncbi:YdiU family protein [Undibacterium sp. CY7W]|uniref:Protein nucleotidyltransferase YdiU n=1 Tax=Undibacterium rugosum TaxID=2762291 RepID=A0A923IB74_9BURK|nr:YdiU family protein [Undibacterium rugosum]MBC3936898.1 YdiU family protein [Undibacterium rugosum]
MRFTSALATMSAPHPNDMTRLSERLQDSQFSQLGDAFFTRLKATPLAQPYYIAHSSKLAQELGIAEQLLRDEDSLSLLSGNQTPAQAQPLAAVYSGHQFGVWAGQLGDGRAILLGALRDNAGQETEIQLKGAGLTPYSRSGDGRAVLRSSIREFLCSEAMAALGIPTSRALCLTGSPQRVYRETPETSAVVTRTASSFIRFGSFEHFYYQRRFDELRQLADFVIQNYFPACLQAENPYQALLIQVCERTAEMIAHWQAVGFMHGVMNTDNMSILGLTLDYGPFGFMEAFDESHICNHTDQQGRYSYRNQPSIGNWNVYALGQALLPLIGSVEQTEQALSSYRSSFEQHWIKLSSAKFGLASNQPEDKVLMDDFFQLLQANHADMTNSFRALSHLNLQTSEADHPLSDLFIDRNGLAQWLLRYRHRLAAETRSETARKAAMRATNPKYVLRNYLAQQAIEQAQQGDFSEIQHLLHVLQTPFEEQPEFEHYAALPPDWAADLEVSCSS